MCSVSTHYLLCYAKLPALMVEEFFLFGFASICSDLFDQSEIAIVSESVDTVMFQPSGLDS